VPIYEYACTVCENVVDVRHGFKETMKESCPVCGGSLKRVFRPAGIVFKGSGFYVTDSRAAKSDSTSDGTAKGQPAKADSSKSDSAKADSSKSDSATPDSPKSDSAKPDSPKSGGSGKSEAAA
jgi:putative FmdB family regulatory protein